MLFQIKKAFFSLALFPVLDNCSYAQIILTNVPAFVQMQSNGCLIVYFDNSRPQINFLLHFDELDFLASVCIKVFQVQEYCLNCLHVSKDTLGTFNYATINFYYPTK